LKGTPKPSNSSRFEAYSSVEIETAAGDDVNCRDILGKPHGIVKRGQEHSGDDADPAGAGGDCRGGRQNRGKIPVFNEVVL
jgi:hypothetical protein